MNSVVPAKRFYKSVSLDGGAGDWRVALDGRALKTPAGAALRIASRRLAEAIAAEWDAQEDRIKPDTMPVFRLLATAIDRVAARRADVIAASLKYAETDLLCYRADKPADLVALQAARWQPVLDWAHERLGARLAVTSGIFPVAQPGEAMAALGKALHALDDFALTGVSALAGATGSLVIAFAISEGHLDPATAAELALLDERFQAEQWGEDPEAAVQRGRTVAEIADTAHFLQLIE